MAYVVKCGQCEFVEYRVKGTPPKKCPDCGGPISKSINPYESEVIRVKISVSFHDLECVINDIVKLNLKDDLREEVLYMIKIYVWLLLRKAPQLWLDIETIVGGIKDLMLCQLRLEKK